MKKSIWYFIAMFCSLIAIPLFWIFVHRFWQLHNNYLQLDTTSITIWSLLFGAISCIGAIVVIGNFGKWFD